MIYGHIDQLSQYTFLESAVKKCFEYAASHDLAEYGKGSHEINGKEWFVNLVEYETTTPENRFWEAHRQYLDIHLMLRGEEQIDIGFIEQMVQKEYVEEDDFLPLEGEKSGSVILREGDFLICFPSDGHRTAVEVHGPEVIRKAIFKVRV